MSNFVSQNPRLNTTQLFTLTCVRQYVNIVAYFFDFAQQS